MPGEGRFQPGVYDHGPHEGIRIRPIHLRVFRDGVVPRHTLAFALGHILDSVARNARRPFAPQWIVVKLPCRVCSAVGTCLERAQWRVAGETFGLDHPP